MIRCGLILLVVCFAQVHSAPEEEKLRSHLRRGYGPQRIQSRPVSDLSDTVTVKHGLSIVDFEFDPESFRFKGLFWMKIGWTDPAMTWDPDNYGGLSQLNMATKHFWNPDVVLFNKLASVGHDETRRYLTVVKSDGSIIWIPPYPQDIRCSDSEDDLQDAPDGTEYVCNLKFGSWTHSGLEMDIVLMDGVQNVDTSHLHENKHYTVTFTSAQRYDIKYPCCPENYPNIQYKIGLAKRS